MRYSGGHRGKYICVLGSLAIHSAAAFTAVDAEKMQEVSAAVMRCRSYRYYLLTGNTLPSVNLNERLVPKQLLCLLYLPFLFIACKLLNKLLLHLS